MPMMMMMMILVPLQRCLKPNIFVSFVALMKLDGLVVTVSLLPEFPLQPIACCRVTSSVAAVGEQ